MLCLSGSIYMHGCITDACTDAGASHHAVSLQCSGLVTHSAVAMQTELTLMAVPSRNISLPTLRKHVEQSMLQNLDMLAKAQKGPDASVHPDDEGALKRLCDLYLDSRLPLL